MIPPETLPDHPETAPPLEVLLTRETALFKELRDCLQQERDAILFHEPEALLSRVLEKEAVLQRLLAARQLRQSCLRHLSGDDSAGLQAQIGRHQKTLEGLQGQIALLNAQNRQMVTDVLDILDEFMDVISGGKQRPVYYQSKGLIRKGKNISRFNCQV